MLLLVASAVLIAASSGAATRPADDQAQTRLAPGSGATRVAPAPSPALRTEAGGFVLNESPLQLLPLQLSAAQNAGRKARTIGARLHRDIPGPQEGRHPLGMDCNTPVNTVAPLVSAPNPAYVGNVITTGNGSWSCPPTSYHYQWLRNGVAISGATSSSYTIQSGNNDVGATIRSSVQACNGIDCSGYVQSSNSVVPANRAPNVPSNLSPADGATITTTAPTLSGTFSDPDGQTGYISFTVNRASTGATVITGQSPSVSSGSTGSWTVPAGYLNTGVTYEWAAEAVDVSGYGSGGVWSSFNVKPNPPTLVSPVGSPAPNVPSTTPALSVATNNPSADTLLYKYQVATDAGFANIVASSADNGSDGFLPTTTTWTATPGKLKDGQNNYYWRAQIETAYGVVSDWTTGQAFNTRTPKLGTRDYWPLWSHGPLAVNEATGNLVASAPGPSYPFANRSLAVSLTYNSIVSDQTNTDRGFGPGWTFDAGDDSSSPPARLIDHSQLSGADQYEAVERVSGDGSSDFYTRVGSSNTYLSSPGDGSQLTKNADGSWGLLDSDGSIYTFDPTGTNGAGTGVAPLRSAEIVDAQKGAAALYLCMQSGKITSIQDISDCNGTPNRKLSMIWNSLNPTGCPGAILCVQGPDGVTWKYIGDGTGGTSGRLVTVFDGVRNVLSITYGSGSNRITSLRNANDLDPTHASPGYNGAHALTVTYDASNRVATVVDGPITDFIKNTSSSSTWSFDYHPGQISTGSPGGPAATRAAHGSLPAGSSRTADGYAFLKPPCQQAGAAAPCSGASKQVKTFYDNLAHPMEVDDLLGNVSENAYNERDELLWSEDEDGNPTDYAYGGVDGSDVSANPWAGDALISVTAPDPDGAGPQARPVTRYRYDETQIGDANNPGAPLQGLQGAYYKNKNLAGRPDALQTDANVNFDWGTGGPAAIGGQSDTFSIRWSGDLVVSTAGSYTFSTVADDGTRLTIDNTLAINNWNDQSAQRVASQPISLTAGLHRITLDYYENAAAASVKLQWACSSCNPAIAEQVIPTSGLRPAWFNQTSTVSATSRMRFSHFADPTAGHPDYNLVKLADGTNVITSYSYDAFGRMTQKVMPKGNAGRTIGADGSLGGTPDATYATTYAYYAAGETAAPPAAPGCSGSAVNQAQLLKSTTPHGLATTTYVYDLAGRLLAKTNGAGTTCSSYDNEGRLTSAQAPGDSQATSYSYDPAGAQRTAIDAGGTVASEYDEAGGLVHSVDSFGAEAKYDYDLDGNQLCRRASASSLSASTTCTTLGSTYATSYSYNDADQLVGMSDPASKQYTFFYDKRGNLHATQYPNGTFSWQDFNLDGWLTGLYNRHGTLPGTLPQTAPADSQASPLGDFSYSYDLDGRKLSESRSDGGLSLSGNEITDSVRSAGTQGDGRVAPDSSTGIWQGTTNLMPNGGAETNVTNWSATGSTVSRDTTAAKFGAASAKVVTQNLRANEGVYILSNTGQGLAAGTTITGSFWIKGGGTWWAYLNIVNTDATQSSGQVVSFTASTSWQRFVTPSLAVAAGKTGDQVRLILVTSSQQAATVNVDGAQIERAPIATPYVQTNGATASRGDSRVQAPAVPLNTAQGWVALRLRVGFAANRAPASDGHLFLWGDDPNNRIDLLYDKTAKVWTTRRRSAGASGTEPSSTVQSFNAGDSETVTMAWTATQLKLSVNGGAFTVGSNTIIPSLSASLFDIGSGGSIYSGQLADSDILWFAAGTGTLTDADAATINGFGNSDKTPEQFPGVAALTWSADSSDYNIAGYGLNHQTTSYSYDAVGRLSQVVLPSGTCRNYGYDLDSNRTQIQESATGCAGTFSTTASYSYDPSNPASPGVDELTSRSQGQTTNFSYNNDGGTTTRGADSITWDGWGRMSGGTFSGTTVSYGFDPLGRRRSRITTSPSKTTHYLFDSGDDTPLFETDGSGTITQTYVQGVASDLAHYGGPPTTSSTVSFLYYNGHGDLAAEANTTGTRSAAYSYDPFGGPNNPVPANSTIQRWTGRWDKEFDTVTSLIQMGARPYDPSLGRFVSVDPVDGASLNQYDYAFQDPINAYDLSGTDPAPKCIKRCPGSGRRKRNHGPSITVILTPDGLAKAADHDVHEDDIRHVFANSEGRYRGITYLFHGEARVAFWHKGVFVITRPTAEGDLELVNAFKTSKAYADRHIRMGRQQLGGK